MSSVADVNMKTPAPLERSRKKPKSHRSGSLDGLRALAVLAVMGVHIGFPGDALGGLGVDLFFVLSGFLITTLLVKEHRETGRIHLPQFWARRFLRLMPAYWLYLVGVMVIFCFTYDKSQTTGSWPVGLYIASLWGYFANYAPEVKIWDQQFITLHLWSLSVEEQFYFIWPLLMAGALLWKRGWVMPWVVVAGVMVVRHCVVGQGDDLWLYTRGIGIVLGSAAAYYLSDRPVWAMKLMGNHGVRWLWAVLTVAVPVALSVLYYQGKLENADVMGTYLPGIDLLFVGVVAGLWYFPGGAISRVLGWGPLAYLGGISYGIYLYHMLAQRMIWNVVLAKPALDWMPPNLAYGVRVGLFLGLTFATAALSYHFLEKPFLSLKERFRAKGGE